jgi:ABC-type uncharacterized transport system permease subunit
MMSNVSVFCFLASYFVTGLLEASRLWGKYTISRLVLKLFGVAGFVAHTWYLVNRSQETTLPPLLSSTHDWLLVLAWLAVLLYLFLTTIDRDLAIGLFLMPVVLALIGAAYFVGQVPNQLVSANVLAQEARHGWAMLHATLLVLGMAGGVIALVVGMMYLVQHHRLKRKQTMTEGVTLPSLGRLARINWWAVMISIPLLTLGMAVGVGLGIWTLQGPSPLRFSDPVIVIYGASWLVMIGFFIWLLTTKRPQDRQIASLTIWSFSFLLVSIVVLSIISSRVSISAHAASPAGLPAPREEA